MLLTTCNFQVDEESLVRYPSIRETGIEEESDNNLPIYTNTLGVVLKASRHIAPYGIITLR